MKIIVRRRLKGDKYEYVKGRERDEKGNRNLLFTNKEAEAKLWNTFYAATDFICKSDTKLEGFEIVQLDNGKTESKTTDLKSANKLDK